MACILTRAGSVAARTSPVTGVVVACRRTGAVEQPLLTRVVEDPIESAVDGVAQSRVNPAAGFDLAAGLRSLMRQDPEAIIIRYQGTGANGKCVLR